MLGNRDTRESFRKMREVVDSERDEEIQRLEEALERAKRELERHPQEKFGWEDEVERLERELEEARGEQADEIADKLDELADEADAIAGEREGRSNKKIRGAAEKVRDGASGLAGKVRGDDDSAGISRPDRIKGYEEILKDMISLEDEEHKEIKSELKGRLGALEGATESLGKARSAWLKEAGQAANNIPAGADRDRAMEIIDTLKKRLRQDVSLGEDVEPDDTRALLDELKGLIDDNVDDRHIGDDYRDTWDDLESEREDAREARDEVEEILEEIDELEAFRREIQEWHDEIRDDEEWKGVANLLKAKLDDLDSVLGDDNRDKASRLRRHHEELSLPATPFGKPGRASRRKLIIGTAVGIALVASSASTIIWNSLSNEDESHDTSAPITEEIVSEATAETAKPTTGEAISVPATPTSESVTVYIEPQVDRRSEPRTTVQEIDATNTTLAEGETDVSAITDDSRDEVSAPADQSSAAPSEEAASDDDDSDPVPVDDAPAHGELNETQPAPAEPPASDEGVDSGADPAAEVSPSQPDEASPVEGDETVPEDEIVIEDEPNVEGEPISDTGPITEPQPGDDAGDAGEDDLLDSVTEADLDDSVSAADDVISIADSCEEEFNSDCSTGDDGVVGDDVIAIPTPNEDEPITP